MHHLGITRSVTRAALGAGVVIVGCVLAPALGLAHPLGNFSINQYAGIRIGPDAIEVRYLVDLAEIPTFQEMQDSGIVAVVGHPSLQRYLPGKIEALKRGLLLDVDGHPLSLQTVSTEILFPPGAGGLPTMKLGALYRASFPPPGSGTRALHYRDTNFASRAGWKEVIAVGGPGVTVEQSSVPERDRSHELADYPTDLLNSPPQDLEAQVVFLPARGGPGLIGGPSASAPSPVRSSAGAAPPPAWSASSAVPSTAATSNEAGEPPSPTVAPGPDSAIRPGETPLGLQPNRQATPRSAFTDLVATPQLRIGVVLVALVVAATLGALHALEPGHGKTIVAAYLVGSRGTAMHAVLLGLIVTATHTGGVYLLGGVTLYASRYVVPERLYPWLGAGSGLAIAVLGVALFLRRYAEAVGRPSPAHPHSHPQGHHHDHGSHGEHGQTASDHGHATHVPGHHVHAHPHGGHRHVPDGPVSVSSLVALGVTGGIVPCPAAVVVLLSALSLHRVGFGLILIVAFSVGLAAVLITIGILMVYTRRLMSRFQGEGPFIQRWLPLASAAVITVFGLGLTVQALIAAGIVQIRF